MWIIRDEAIRQRLIEHIKQVPLGAVVKITNKEPPRTAQQNSTLHMWCEDFIKTGDFKTPDGALYSLLMMKEEFKEVYLPKKTWTNRKGVEKVMPISTAELDVTKFSNFLNKIYITAQQIDVRLRDPAERGLKPQIKDKTWKT